MKSTKVTVTSEHGLHLRPAAKIVHLARSFQSSISLKVKERSADARNIMAILMLCATMGTMVSVEASGVDEDEAVTAISQALTEDADELAIEEEEM